MPVLYRASIGFLLRHPWQLGLALLGICIGVAAIVAIDLAIESSRKAFLALRQSSVEVLGKSLGPCQSAGQRSVLPASAVRASARHCVLPRKDCNCSVETDCRA